MVYYTMYHTIYDCDTTTCHIPSYIYYHNLPYYTIHHTSFLKLVLSLKCVSHDFFHCVLRDVCWILESKSEDSLLNDQDSNGKTPIDYAISKTNGLQLVFSEI